jgi:hypothetical protein
MTSEQVKQGDVLSREVIALVHEVVVLVKKTNPSGRGGGAGAPPRGG